MNEYSNMISPHFSPKIITNVSQSYGILTLPSNTVNILFCLQMHMLVPTKYSYIGISFDIFSGLTSVDSLSSRLNVSDKDLIRKVYLYIFDLLIYALSLSNADLFIAVQERKLSLFHKR